MKGQIDSLSIGRGLSSPSLVEDSVVSPLDPLGKKLSIDHSFLLRSAMTMYQQYCASDHVLSIHKTRTLIGSPYPIRRHYIIGSRYPEHFCRCKYKYTVQYKNQQRRSLPNSGGIGDFSTSFFFLYYFLRHNGARTYFFLRQNMKTCAIGAMAQPSLNTAIPFSEE